MLVLPAELTQRQARGCLDMLLHTLRHEADRDVIADASALTRFDSSALAVMLACRRECLADDKTFAVLGMSPKLRALADLYGVGPLLPAAS